MRIQNGSEITIENLEKFRVKISRDILHIKSKGAVPQIELVLSQMMVFVYLQNPYLIEGCKDSIGENLIFSNDEVGPFFYHSKDTKKIIKYRFEELVKNA